MNDYDRLQLNRLNKNLENIKFKKENNDINLINIAIAAGIIILGLLIF